MTMVKSIVTLECGCFFNGREFIADSACEEHAEEADGDTAVCDKCAGQFHIDELDGKPEITRWLSVVRFFRGQVYMLRYAADRGHDFTRLECGECYGPGYVNLRKDHVQD